ncbi:MAG: type II toxin-antitoxin system death-on-curing family toxin [Caulobacterales bacterium]|nr:type II toxin-antitoxin system death-on-curing family toxin [Caulobacterales bacterium]
MKIGVEPRWITKLGVIVLHDMSIATDGGAPGIRDEGLLESALDRPKNRFHYEGVTDLPALAATYAVGLAKNHAFADGNKRVAFIAAGLFLEKNGLSLTATQADAALTMLAVAAGEIEIDQLADWIRRNVIAT